MSRRTLCLAVALLLLVGVRSARADSNTNQLWADYHLHFYPNERQEIYADMGLRVLTDSKAWRRAYIRPSLRIHRFGAFEPHLALALFYTDYTDFASTTELRPSLGLKLRWPKVGPLTFTHYGRLEYRGTWTDGEYDSSGRLRYKLSTRIPLVLAPAGLGLDRFYIPLSIEFFGDFEPNVDPLFQDEIRLDAGLGYTAGESWVFEAHFIAQRSRSGQDAEFETSDYIVRLQIKNLIRSKDYRYQRQDLPD